MRGVETGQAVLHFAKRVYIISRINRTHKIVPAISESGMIDPWSCKASHVNIAFHRGNNGVVSCNEGLRDRKSLLGAAEGYGRKRLLTRLPERTTPHRSLLSFPDTDLLEYAIFCSFATRYVYDSQRGSQLPKTFEIHEGL